MPGLCDLPDEVILLTLNCGPFSPADFAALALSCRRLKHVAEDALYAQNRDHEWSSAIDWAAKHGNIATLDKALNHGLSIEPIDKEHSPDDEEHSSDDEDSSPVPQFNPFQTAVENGQDSAVIWLLDHGADITRRIRPRCRCSIDETCILHSAICSRHASTALLLISRGAPLEYLSRDRGRLDDGDVNALKEASLFGLDSVVESLVKDHNMNQVFIKLFDMHLPLGVQHALSWAAMADGNVLMIKKLVNLGADVNWPGSEWEASPLHMAIANGSFAVAHALLDLGAEIRPHDFDCSEDEEDEQSEWEPEETVFSPLHDTIALDFEDETPLREIYSCSLGRRSSRKVWNSERDRFMKRLIELGVDVNMEAYGEWYTEMPFSRPLELAVAKENINHVSTLIAAGATVSSEMLRTAWTGYDGFGNTKQYMKMVKPLLKHGARLDEPIESGLSMLQLVAREAELVGLNGDVSGLHYLLVLSTPTNLSREHLTQVLADCITNLDWYTTTILIRHGAHLSGEDELYTIASTIAEKLESGSRHFSEDPEQASMYPSSGLYECMGFILDMGLSNEDQCLVFHDILHKQHIVLAHLFLDRGLASKPEAIKYLVAYLMLAAAWGNVGVIKRLWQQAHQYLGPVHRLLIVYSAIIRNRKQAVSFFMDHGVMPFESLSPAQSRNAYRLREDVERKEGPVIRTLKEGSSDALEALTVSRQKRKILLTALTHGIGMVKDYCLSRYMSPLQLAVRYGHLDMISDILEYIPQDVDVNVMLWKIHIPKVLRKANEIRLMMEEAADLALWSRKVRAKQME